MKPDPVMQESASRQRFLEDLPTRLEVLLNRLRGQCRNGWDINVVQQLHAELTTLSGACNHHGQLEISNQLQALETALTPALTRMRLPDAGMTALVAALVDHLQQLAPPAGSAPSAPRHTESPQDGHSESPIELIAGGSRGEYRVLVATVHAERSKLLRENLQRAGFNVRVLDEPLATLEELSRFSPQCILLDLHMPVCDGPELAAMIRERRDFADIPVLYLAAEPDDATVQDVLSPDLGEAELVAAVRQHVDARRWHTGEPFDIGRARAPHRRAWLIDRLDATLASGEQIRGGLLDVIIDNARDLHRRIGIAALVAVHEQLGELVSTLLEPGEMLAENGAGFLLLSRTRDSDGMRSLAADIQTRVSRERFGPMAAPVSVTMGGCLLNGELDRSDAVVSAALKARQTATAGETSWYHRNGGHIDPLQLEAAINEDRLHLVFQAIVSLYGASQPQYQSLLRMRDPEGYVHTASELVPVARRSGLIPALDRWTLDRCLALLGGYQRRTRPMRLFVSQSVETLRKADYPTWLAARLSASGVRGARLVVEFRSDEVGQAPRELLRAAPKLRELGVGICLSGMDRSLRCAELLDAVPLNYIKLVPSLLANPGALISIAHARNIAVIAPQVEDESMIAQLRGLGVDSVQGNSLAHPARALNYQFDEAAQTA